MTEAEKEKTIDGLIKDIGTMNDKCVEIRRAQCKRIEELKEGGKQLQVDLTAAKKKIKDVYADFDGSMRFAAKRIAGLETDLAGAKEEIEKWNKVCDDVVRGDRQSCERIAELEAENKQLQGKLRLQTDVATGAKGIARQLQAEVEELQKEVSRNMAERALKKGGEQK